MKVSRYDSTPRAGCYDRISPYDAMPSGFNQYYTRRQAMPYGRQMRGLGATNLSPYHRDSWSGEDPAVQMAADDDDSVGNGIFDGEGAAPVQHAGSGVFEARYAEPGYLYRERMGEPSESVDTTNGNPIVYHSNAGGSSHEDFLRTYRQFDLETPRWYGRADRGVKPTDIAPTPPAATPPSTPVTVAGFGQTLGTGAATYVPYAIGGVLIGVAVGMLYGKYKGK